MIRKTTTGGDDTTTSIKILHQNIISIYPNPSNNHIILEIDDLENNRINIEILNSSGQVQFSKQKINNKKNLLVDVSKFARGIYFVKVHFDEQVIIKRFIIQ